MPTLQPLDALHLLMEQAGHGDLAPLRKRAPSARAAVYMCIMERVGIPSEFLKLIATCPEHRLIPAVDIYAIGLPTQPPEPVMVGMENGAVGQEAIRQAVLQDIIARQAAPANATLLIKQLFRTDATPRQVLDAEGALSDLASDGFTIEQFIDRGAALIEQRLLRQDTPVVSTRPASKRL